MMTLADDFFEPEELHPELAEYLEDTPTIGEILRHPLVYQVPYSPLMNRLSNRMFAQKTEAIAAAIEQQNWHKFVFLHERPYRLDALEKVTQEHGIDDPGVVWPLISSVWIDSENIGDNFGRWRSMWDRGSKKRAVKCMTQSERFALQAMSDTITIYRGVGHPNAVSGLSWTIDREKAKWFANRFSNKNRDAFLAEATVSRSNVLAYFTGRGENEIVVFPEDVKIKNVVPLFSH